MKDKIIKWLISKLLLSYNYGTTIKRKEVKEGKKTEFTDDELWNMIIGLETLMSQPTLSKKYKVKLRYLTAKAESKRKN